MLVYLNNAIFDKKPNSQQTAWIRKNMNAAELSIAKLKNSLCFGKTIQPAILDNDNKFISQQVFLVDVDSSTVSETIDSAKKNNICPNIIYRTFSGGIRHRIVFVFEEPITDLDERNNITNILIKKFNGDVKTKALKNLFYGGTVCYFFNPFKCLNKEEVLKYGAI